MTKLGPREATIRPLDASEVLICVLSSPFSFLTAIDQLGILYTLNGALVVLLQYPISRLLLRYSYSKTLAVASAVRAAGFLMIAGLSGFGWLQVVIVAPTFGEILQTPAGASYAAVLATETIRGECLGVYNWMWSSGLALSPIVRSCLET